MYANMLPILMLVILDFQGRAGNHARIFRGKQSGPTATAIFEETIRADC
jgi:hypothetical protein